MNIIETQNLTKSYADFTAVSGIDLHIPKRCCLWLSRSERSRKIHYYENVFGAYQIDKRLVYD